MVAFDTTKNKGFVFLHSWPNAPTWKRTNGYLLDSGSFENTQHAFCMNLGILQSHNSFILKLLI